MARLIIGNWKMNLGPEEAVKLAERLSKIVKHGDYVEVVVCPPFVDIVPVVQALKDGVIKIGAQNVSSADHGAYTGEVSAMMLRGLADYVIVGHSERRAMGESDAEVGRKAAAVNRNGLTPVLCVGDKLSDRDHGLATRVVHDQLVAGLDHLTAEEVGHMVVAYEPVWAIGTGEFARPDGVKQVVDSIRSTVGELYGAAAAGSLRVLYGGSVAPENAAMYLREAGVDGLLVGGASIRSEEFAAIVAAAK
jgi:triosephosphate isomerase